MKKLLIVLAFITFGISSSYAQRLAYVDSEYVLKHIPEYTTAQKQIDALSSQWQSEVDNKYADIEKMYKAYQNDQSVLNEDMRRRREDEIVRKEKEVKDYQRTKFGYEGDLFKERTRLMKPIQDRLSKAIKDIANTQGLDLILDRGTEASFLYANPNLDKSNDIITKLGLKPNPALAK